MPLGCLFSAFFLLLLLFWLTLFEYLMTSTLKLLGFDHVSKSHAEDWNGSNNSNRALAPTVTDVVVFEASTSVLQMRREKVKLKGVMLIRFQLCEFSVNLGLCILSESLSQ